MKVEIQEYRITFTRKEYEDLREVLNQALWAGAAADAALRLENAIKEELNERT